MGRAALLALGGGGLSGAAALAALAGSPLAAILVYLAPLPLLLVGLGLGANAFGFAAAAGIAIAFAFGGFAGAGLYGGMHVIPSWLIVQQALRPRASSADGWLPIGNILATLALLVAFVMAVTAVAARGDLGIEAGVRTLLSAVVELMAPTLEETQRVGLVGRLTPVFLGFSAVTWLTMLVLNGVVAQSTLARWQRSRRPLPRWSDVRLPVWFDWVLVAGAAIALLTSGDAQFLARNVVLILLAPYFFVGLAVMHIVARRTPLPTVALAAVYFILLVFFLFAAPTVAGVGVFEQWIGLRHRLAPAGRPRAPE